MINGMRYTQNIVQTIDSVWKLGQPICAQSCEMHHDHTIMLIWLLSRYDNIIILCI